MMEKKQVLLSYYGDDFTGSADVMESLSLMGIPTILFLSPPKSSDLDNFVWKNKPTASAKWVAYGVAGIARSLDPDAMEAELDPIFHKMSRIPSRFFHYKICSTLDSSPEIGNIGKALEVAEKYFPSNFIPMIMGPPVLNRFVVFGHLFARIGKETYRLDRHPVMSKHPITPMNESDIRLHLKKQMTRNMALVDYFGLENIMDYKPQNLFQDFNFRDRAPLVLFDTLEDTHLKQIGQWLDVYGDDKHQMILGSSAVEYALGETFGTKMNLKNKGKPISPTLIVSGSCSQTTADQIGHVQKLGYAGIRLEVSRLFDSDTAVLEVQRVIDEAVRELKEGKNTLIYSALGPLDPQVQTGVLHAEPQNIAKNQALITKSILEQFPVKRLVTAGGDTSGYILKALEIQALEFQHVLAPGAPLCMAHAKSQAIDGLEIAIKGGQNGTPRYFEWAQKGGIG